MSFFKIDKENQSKTTAVIKNKPLFPSLADNVTYICEAYYHTNDLKVREVTFQQKQGKLFYLETMADTKEIEQSFLAPLKEADKEQQIKDIITNVEFTISTNLIDSVSALLIGSCALLFDGEKEAYIFNTPQENTRSPDEPDNEKVVRGSHQGFVEGLDVNLNLIRQRIKNRQLMITNHELGMESNTKVSLIYMKKLADPALVDELEKRILSISMDMIFGPGFIEECIEENPFSPFPQLLFTERPDRLEANLMEGRVAIMSEGSSVAIIMPVTFFSFFQSPDDVNIKFYAGSIFRLLRLFSFWGTLLFPPLYIAVVGFHFEIIPYDMVTLVKSSVENVPFPPFFEALLMAVTIELIREAGIRLPTPIGQTIGIVGGLIIGDAVVSAGFVSNVMVIVIALTAIMSFTIPSYEMGNTARILSLPLMIAAATLGFVGIVVMLMFIGIHMCKLQSFGTPYISPLAPLHVTGLKDAIVRFPVWLMNKRPKEIDAQERLKQGPSREWEENDQQ